MWWIRCFLDNVPLTFLDGKLAFERSYKGNSVVMHGKVNKEYYRYTDLQSP